MARPKTLDPELEQQVIRLRKERWSCRDVAHELGLSRGQVYSIMRRNGLNGKLRGRSKDVVRRRPDRAASMADKVRRHGVVTLEAGAAGGFIATIDDTWTGSESRTLIGAINSAEEAKG